MRKDNDAIAWKVFAAAVGAINRTVQNLGSNEKIQSKSELCKKGERMVRIASFISKIYNTLFNIVKYVSTALSWEEKSFSLSKNTETCNEIS